VEALILGCLEAQGGNKVFGKIRIKRQLGGSRGCGQKRGAKKTFRKCTEANTVHRPTTKDGSRA